MPITATFRDLERLSDRDLLRPCRLRSSYWEEKGRPPFETMPVSWRLDVERIRDELRRRGTQLSLF